MPARTNTVDDIATYLEDQSLVNGNTGWPLTKYNLSETSEKNVMITTIGGGPPITASQTKNPTFQIILRGAKDNLAAATTKAREILDALAYIDETRLTGASGTMYNMIRSLQSEPVYMGPDDKTQSPLFSMNFEALRSTINSGA